MRLSGGGHLTSAAASDRLFVIGCMMHRASRGVNVRVAGQWERGWKPGPEEVPAASPFFPRRGPLMEHMWPKGAAAGVGGRPEALPGRGVQATG
jgi:hypothetical protein